MNYVEINEINEMREQLASLKRQLSSQQIVNDRLLKEANVVTTPGAGFGKAGEGYIRISAFNSRANVLEAIERLGRAL